LIYNALKQSAMTGASPILEQLQKLRRRIVEGYVLGTKLITVSRIRMLEAIEDELAILQDSNATLLQKEMAELAAKLLIRIEADHD